MEGLKVLTKINDIEEKIESGLPAATSNGGAYTQSLLFNSRFTLTSVTINQNNIPETHTQYVVAKEQPLEINDIVSSFAVSSLYTPYMATVTLNASNPSVTIPNFKPSTGTPIKFVFNVTAISDTPPKLYLAGWKNNRKDLICDRRDMSDNTTFKDTTLGIFYCKTGSVNGDLSEADPAEPYITMGDDDISNGRSVTFTILGIYTNCFNFLENDDNYQVGIRFTGSTTSDVGFNCKINGTSYTIPTIRQFNGIGDYIEGNKVHRKIAKTQLTTSMLHSSATPKVGKKSTLFYLDNAKTNFTSDVDWKWYENTGFYLLVYADSIPSCDYITTTTANYTAIGNGYVSAASADVIVVRIKNSDLGVTYGTSYTTSELTSKLSTYLSSNPITMYYPTSKETIEEFTQPQLVDGINKIEFIYPTPIDATIMCKVQHENSRYNGLSGKAWWAIGDSITAAVASTFSYSKLANSIIPDCITYNGGHSGWKVRTWSDVIDENGDRLASDSTGSSYSYNIDSEIVALKNKITMPPNVVTIALGVNDRSYIKFGSIHDAPSNAADASFFACYHYMIRAIIKNFPMVKIVIVSPPRTSQDASGYITCKEDIAEIGFNIGFSDSTKLLKDSTDLSSSDNYFSYEKGYVFNQTPILRGQTVTTVDITGRLSTTSATDDWSIKENTRKNTVSVYFVAKNPNHPNYDIIGKRRVVIDTEGAKSYTLDSPFTAPENCYVAVYGANIKMASTPTLANSNICTKVALNHYYCDDSVILVEESCNAIQRACEQIAQYYNFKFININNGGGFINLFNEYCGDTSDLLGSAYWGSGDFLHPNDLAHAVMFDAIASQI